MNNTPTFISVVIPTYNRKEILGKCLDAFGDQSYPEDGYEIIVVDDGSTDGTKELLEDASAKTANLRYLTQKQGGPAKARNLGIQEARGPIILITGDDCIPHPHLVEEHARSHREGKKVAVLGRIEWHPDLEITPFMHYISMDWQFSFPKIEKTWLAVPYGYFYTSNISLAKEILLSAGLFDGDFKDAVFEDWEMGYRIWKMGVGMLYNKKAITYHFHPVTLEHYIQRNLRMGRAGALIYKKHPELKENQAFLMDELVDPRARWDFYNAVLRYHYLVGLQEGLEKPDTLGATGLIPLEDRLANWSSEAVMRLAAKVREQRLEIKRLHEHVANIEGQMHEVIPEKDRLIEELNSKNMEKYYRIVELEKFECRVKSSILFRFFDLFRKLLRKST